MVTSCIRPASGRCGARRRILLLLLSGLFVTAIAPLPGLAQIAVMGRAVAVHPHGAHIEEASQRFGIPAAWIIAVMQVESAGNMHAISSAGAMGLMQVMPSTWAELRIRHALGRDPFEPRDNILAGTAYLREMWDRYGNVAAMLAAYNAGPGRYDEYLATGRVLPAETRAYVAALVPSLGGATALEVAKPAPAPPPDWRAAPLFVARSGDAETATVEQSGDVRATVPARDPADAEPHGGSIFVARADDGGAR